jgi:pyocin large subunit-like protein
MKARELISNASYGPETLKIVFQSFDQAWESIASNFGDNPLAIQAARVKLANIILSIPHDHQSDAQQIKNSALKMMARDYRTGSNSG